MKSIAVFCGSNFGTSPEYAEAAAALGREIAARGLLLVYGGTHMGLMGILADAALDAGGEVFGVINQRLHAKGHLHPRLTRHEIAASMRERKARMADIADAFVALPGGLGTLEEIFEVATLTQLGDHRKACGLLNVRGFYTHVYAQLDHAVAEGFMKAEHRDMVLLQAAPAPLLDGLAAWVAPSVDKWIARPAPAAGAQP